MLACCVHGLVFADLHNRRRAYRLSHSLLQFLHVQVCCQRNPNTTRRIACDWMRQLLSSTFTETRFAALIVYRAFGIIKTLVSAHKHHIYLLARCTRGVGVRAHACACVCVCRYCLARTYLYHRVSFNLVVKIDRCCFLRTIVRTHAQTHTSFRSV